MKHLFLALAAFCITTCSYFSIPAFADAPQPGILQFTFTNGTVSLGEPLILKYQITNLENRRINVYMGKDKRGWLNMRLRDASGNPVQTIPDPIPTKGGLHINGTVVDPNGHDEDYVVVTQKFQPTHQGRYRLSLSAHLIYSWDDASDEKFIDDQDFSLVITVTNRDPQRLHAVAEGLRQTVMQDKIVSEYQLATEALFSMHDPDCLPVWRELATDPTLDPWRAMDVIHHLTHVGSLSASNLLAEMQTVAPERWARTGLGPLNALEDMRRTASPELKQHINQLLAAAGVSLNHVPYGSAN